MLDSKQVQAFFDAIEQADSIVVFRHVSPDPDATGSQLGLCEWIRKEYPYKKVYAAGQGEEMDDVDDETIKNSLAIITDTANGPRVDGPYTLAPKAARIDHHVKVEDFGPLDLVDEKAAAACEIEALMLKSAHKTIGAKAAQQMMRGLMADTQRFTIPTVRPQTFEAAAWLMEQGASPSEAAKSLYNQPYVIFQYAAKVRSKAKRCGNFLFALMNQSDYLELGLSFEEAKNQVNALNSIAGMQIWALFTEDLDHTYSGSLRSAQKSVRELAEQFGGGGHECACGIKKLTALTLPQLVEALDKLANDHQPF
ncbi:bifunctional oligoribonuclease/PAP phosphatase NrnA [Erysipelotrichaceae bacterium RD49]|nr:bifunctional oligoribonuclease/PAP phosphatase NrnA [Erysipelotrichaceae bacterium RD49]